jgi:hypothetical protein
VDFSTLHHRLKNRSSAWNDLILWNRAYPGDPSRTSSANISIAGQHLAFAVQQSQLPDSIGICCTAISIAGQRAPALKMCVKKTAHRVASKALEVLNHLDVGLHRLYGLECGDDSGRGIPARFRRCASLYRPWDGHPASLGGLGAGTGRQDPLQ